MVFLFFLFKKGSFHTFFHKQPTISFTQSKSNLLFSLANDFMSDRQAIFLTQGIIKKR